MRILSIAALCLAPSLALAQTAHSPADPLGPVNPQVKGPPTTYRSAFETRPQGTDEVPWAAANEEVRRIGGHVGSLREDEAMPQSRDNSPSQANRGGPMANAPESHPMSGHRHD
jgi:hypothetical protein